MAVKNPADISFANIGSPILFLDTIKKFQQSLGAPAKSLTVEKKSAISRECEKFIKNDTKLAKNNYRAPKNKNWYLLICQQEMALTVPHKMITSYDSLGIAPEKGQFFFTHQFYSSLKDNIVTDEEYENM